MEQIRSLSAIRADIDAVDAQLLSLFMQRMALAGEVAQAKRKSNSPLSHPGREQEILRRVGDEAGEKLAPYAQRLFQTLFTLSKEYQAQMMENAKETDA